MTPKSCKHAKSNMHIGMRQKGLTWAYKHQPSAQCATGISKRVAQMPTQLCTAQSGNAEDGAASISTEKRYLVAKRPRTSKSRSNKLVPCATSTDATKSRRNHMAAVLQKSSGTVPEVRRGSSVTELHPSTRQEGQGVLRPQSAEAWEGGACCPCGAAAWWKQSSAPTSPCGPP